MPLLRTPSRAGQVVLVVTGGLTSLNFFGMVGVNPIWEDRGFLVEAAYGVACVLPALAVSRWWGAVVLASQPVIWATMLSVVWATSSVYDGGDVRSFADAGITTPQIDPETRLYLRPVEPLFYADCNPAWSPDMAEQGQAAKLVARAFGPPSWAYTGPLLSGAEAVSLAQAGEPIEYSAQALSQRFVVPELAFYLLSPAGFWDVRPKALVPLAVTNVGDSGVLVSWKDAGLLELYDRRTAVLVDVWAPGRPGVERAARDRIGRADPQARRGERL